MPQEPLENESQLVSRDPWFNMGLRDGVQAAMETEETIDRVITTTIDAVISLEESDMNQRVVMSVRMSIDEGLGYIGGQRLCHERPYLLMPALDQFATLSWHAMRRSHFDRTQYRSGFHEGYVDELNGLAQPLAL